VATAKNSTTITTRPTNASLSTLWLSMKGAGPIKVKARTTRTTTPLASQSWPQRMVLLQGQVLGFCGNSGMSSEPHIHFHVQNTPVTQDATGLRCVFDKITVTKNDKSELRTSYSPVKGDIVSQE
jgi:hypothetical protein